MASSRQLISSQTLASSTATVTFSSIPSTFTDLVLRWSARSDVGSKVMKITFNGTTANYSTRYVYGNGATVSSTTGSSTDIRGYASLDLSTDTASTFSSDELYIPSYTVAQNKPVSLSESTENNGTTAYIFAGAGLWQNTGAITSITLTANSGNIVTSSSFYLYGIKNS